MLIPMMTFFASEMVPATLTTYTQENYDTAGELVPAVTTTTPIQVVSPQPVKADELKMEEDGESISDYVKTFTSAAVKTRVEATPADTLTVLGQIYKVHQIEDRPIGAFRKIIMRRLDA